MTEKLEKVNHGLDCCLSAKHPIPCHECDYYNNTDYNDVWSCRLSLMRDARELLKAQEPIKPTVSVDTRICGKCGHTLESQELIDDKENPQILVHEQYQYCPNCGRAVKWE